MNEKSDAYHDICMRADTVLYWSPLIHLQVTEFYKKVKSGIAWIKPPDTTGKFLGFFLLSGSGSNYCEFFLPTELTKLIVVFLGTAILPVDSPVTENTETAPPKSILRFRFNKAFSIIAKLAKSHSVEISAGMYN